MLKVLIIGRTEWLLNTANLIKDKVDIVGVVTSLEAKEYKVGIKDFKDLSENLGVPFFESKFNNKNALKEFIESLGSIDYGVSVNHPFIISEDIISLFNFGILNAHGGDLPRYRGNACQAWAILNGEEKIGLCVHKMLGGELDSGDIIERSYFDVSIQTKIREVFNWFEEEIPVLFNNALQRLETDSSYILEKQNEAMALRCFPRLPEDGRIDWNQSAEQILRLINVSGDPYEGAFTFLDNVKIVILDSKIYYPNYTFLAKFGQVCEIEDDYALISTNDAMIKINSIKVNHQIVPIKSVFKSIRQRVL